MLTATPADVGGQSGGRFLIRWCFIIDTFLMSLILCSLVYNANNRNFKDYALLKFVNLAHFSDKSKITKLYKQPTLKDTFGQALKRLCSQSSRLLVQRALNLHPTNVIKKNVSWQNHLWTIISVCNMVNYRISCYSCYYSWLFLWLSGSGLSQYVAHFCIDRNLNTS